MKYHLVGIGGVGMSALAQLLLDLGHRVSGSDRYQDQGRELPVLAKLRSLGIELMPQDGGGVTAETDAVIVSTAIENNNPDIRAAQSRGKKIIHRAEMLAALARDKKCIAVTGTAGKSTVTGMLGWIFAELGLDPTVVNGAPVLNWVSDRRPGNFRSGRSDIWILELDESDRSLLHFSPDWAVITNISKDHFELEEVRDLFAAFAKRVKHRIVGCAPLANFEKADFDSPEKGGSPQVRPPQIVETRDKTDLEGEAEPSRKPFSAESNFQPIVMERGIAFKYRSVEFRLPLLGLHNAENAVHCVMLCEKLGLDLKAVGKALEKFRGIERRLEVIGRTGGITVIDDYAHNPAKIAAAWDAVRAFSERILAVWRPHGYGPLALMRRELVEVFSAKARPGDLVYIMDVYYAGGTAKKEVTSEMLAADLARKDVPAFFAAGYEELRPRLLKEAKSGAAVLCMGARDPDLPVFVRRIFLELDHLVMDRAAGAGGIAQENGAADQA